MANTCKRVSLKDIASKAGVSTALVSIVLNGKQKQHRVREDVAKRIRQIASELNYKPNSAAKSLRGGRSYTIGVIVSDISNPFFASVARHIEMAAEQRDYTVQFSSSDEKAERTRELMESMLNRGVDCLIVVPCEGSRDIIKKVADDKVPIVLFDRYFPDINTSYVCLDNKKAAYDAAEHLVRQGFKKIGMIAYGMQLQHMNDRVEGYKNALRDNGMESTIAVEYVSYESIQKNCVRAITKMIENDFDAVIFATNTIALECLQHISQVGVRVPDQLGLVGFDGGNAFDFFYSPMTYIQQPIELMARKTVETLLDIVDSEESMTQRIEVKGTLVKRASSIKQ